MIPPGCIFDMKPKSIRFSCDAKFDTQVDSSWQYFKNDTLGWFFQAVSLMQNLRSILLSCDAKFDILGWFS